MAIPALVPVERRIPCRPWFVVLLFWHCSVSIACLLVAERILTPDDWVILIYTFIVSRFSPLREPEATLEVVYNLVFFEKVLKKTKNKPTTKL